MDFEYRFISAVLEKANISFEIADIINIDTEDPDRIYFNLETESGTFFLRLWDMQNVGNGWNIDYTLFKDLVDGGTEEITNGTFFNETE